MYHTIIEPLASNPIKPVMEIFSKAFKEVCSDFVFKITGAGDNTISWLLMWMEAAVRPEKSERKGIYVIVIVRSDGKPLVYVGMAGGKKEFKGRFRTHRNPKTWARWEKMGVGKRISYLCKLLPICRLVWRIC